MSSISKIVTFSNEEQTQIQQLRKKVHDILPPDLDTDFNLRRWVHGWNGDIEQASKHLSDYIKNRRAAKLDGADLPDQFLTHPILQSFGLYFSFSIMPDAINPIDNTIVVIQRLDNIDFHQMARILTCGNFLALYFLMCERVLRQTIKRESETERSSGLTIIYDLANFPLWHYLNPNSPIHKIHKLCLQLMQDYYCDMLHRVYIVNAPTMVGILLEIVKKFLNPMTQEKLVLISDKETLFKHVHPSIVPACFGGNFKLDNEQLEEFGKLNLWVNPDNCSLIPRTVSEKDYFVPKQFPVSMNVEFMRPKQKVEVRLETIGNNAKLWWQFRVNSEILFGILRIETNGDRHLVVPRLVVNTPKLPEEGNVTCDASCAYVLEFVNCSTRLFSLKLEYVAYVDEANRTS